MPAESNQMELLSQAKRAIAQARTLTEVKQIRDKAEAIRMYARATKDSLVIQQHAAEVKIRAERKGGELLAVMTKHNGNPRSHDVTRLKDIGIERMPRCQPIGGEGIQMEKNTQQSLERQSDALAVLLSADELASYAEAQRVCEAFPNDNTSGTGILTCDLARLLIVIDRLAASAVAAPDLLAACEALRQATRDCGYDCRQGDVADAQKLSDAAISAAEGQAS